jgi:hypothetical protein
MRALRLLGAPLAAFLLCACATTSLLPDEISMSAGELNAQFARRFPVTREAAGGLVAFEFTRPEITMGTSTDRMTFAVDISVRSPKLAVFVDRPIATRTTFSGVPRYDPQTLGLYLGDVRIERFEGLSASEGKLLSPAIRMAGEIPIHTFRPGDFTRFGIRYEPRSVGVRGGQLVLRLARPG